MPTIVGLFQQCEDAEAVLQELQARKIGTDQIGVLGRQQELEHRLPDRSGEAAAASQTPTGDGTAAGMAGGAVAGGLSGLLVGLSTLAVPGLGPVYAMGALAIALSAAGAGAGLGLLAGGAVGALMEWGLSEDEASAYAEGIKRGGILVAAQVDEDAASEIRGRFRDAGAIDINTYREHLKQDGWKRFDDSTAPGEKNPSFV